MFTSRVNMIIHDTETVGNTNIFNSVSCIIILAQGLSHTRWYSWAAFRNGIRIRYGVILSLFTSNGR